MITSFSAHPKPQNNNSKIVMGVCFVLSAITFALMFFMEHYRGVVGMVALALITTAILMYTKYVSVRFFYDVIADEGEPPLFVVRQRIGKRDVTLCRVELADVLSIKKETAAERRAYKREQGIAMYVYAPTLSPAVSYRMTVKSRYEKAEIILEGSEEFFAKIVDFAAEARANRQQEDE